MSQTGNIAYVQNKLAWMREQKIWPNGLRYLWTDAFGVILLVSLYELLGDREYLAQAEQVVADVERVLGRERGIRIGEASDRDGQYFHYLAMWLYALAMLGRHDPAYTHRGIALVRAIHTPFLLPGRGVFWKMREDLSGPYPGYGLGALDCFDGYIAYRMLDAQALAQEIAELKELMDANYARLHITQDLGLGMMLWLSHFFPAEDWAVLQKHRCLATLDTLWQGAGYFCREPNQPRVKFAFTNYGVAIGLQATGAMSARVSRLQSFFEHYRAGDEYDTAAITHVMACNAHFPGVLLAGALA